MQICSDEKSVQAVKPIMIIKIALYTKKEIASVFIPCIWVSLASVPVPVLSSFYINYDTFIGLLAMAIITVVSVAISVYFVGLDKNTRKKVIGEIKKVVHKIIR